MASHWLHSTENRIWLGLFTGVRFYPLHAYKVVVLFAKGHSLLLSIVGVATCFATFFQ